MLLSPLTTLRRTDRAPRPPSFALLSLFLFLAWSLRSSLGVLPVTGVVKPSSLSMEALSAATAAAEPPTADEDACLASDTSSSLWALLLLWLPPPMMRPPPMPPMSPLATTDILPAVASAPPNTPLSWITKKIHKLTLAFFLSIVHLI